MTEAGAGEAGADGQDQRVADAPADPAADPRASAGGADVATSAGGAMSAGGAAGTDGVMDLLGLLGYASLVAFFQLSADAALATSLDDKAALAGMAAAQFGHFRLVRDQIERAHAVPAEAMRPFADVIDAFHARTAPADWLEGLVKAYVGDGIAADFYRMVAELLDPSAKALVDEVLSDTGHAEFAIGAVRAAIEADPSVAGRLALWARRLLGEALGQAHRVAAEREPLARLLAGRTAGQPGQIGQMFATLADAHAQRMAALGLAD